MGVIKENQSVSHTPLQKGDKIIVNGNLAEHGVAVMSKRENLQFMTNILSDAAPLHDLIKALFDNNCQIKTMRDPTRGGIAATLNEWAHQYQVGICVDEERLPISQEVYSACELLGLDPLFIANEGKVLMVCSENEADKVLQVLKQHPKGQNAAIIGEVVNNGNAHVVMKTSFGGMRRVDWLTGEQLPRIC